MKNIPEKIYLQIDTGGDTVDDFKTLKEVTWCYHRINDEDIEYTLSPSDDKAGELVEALEELMEEYKRTADDYAQSQGTSWEEIFKNEELPPVYIKAQTALNNYKNK